VEAALRKLFPSGHEDFIALTLKELQLHSDKNNDYSGGPGNDPWGNFHRVAGILSLYPNLDVSRPAVVAIIYLLKQLDAILWTLSCGHSLKVENLEERLRDISVYSKIISILEEEKCKTK